MVPLKNNPTLCCVWILLYVIYYQINYFFYIIGIFPFNDVLWKENPTDWGKRLSLKWIEPPAVTQLHRSKSERGAHLCSSLLCSCHPVLWKPQFLRPSNKLKPLTALQESARFSVLRLQKQPPVDWAAECEASPEYRQTLLHSPAQTVYTNLMYSFVIYIRATGSLSTEPWLICPAIMSWFSSPTYYIISTQMCCLIIGTKVILLQIKTLSKNKCFLHRRKKKPHQFSILIFSKKITENILGLHISFGSLY